MTFGRFVFLVFAYLCGSIPFGLLIGRYFGRVDIRKHGSGNIGATNVARIMGKKWAFLTFILDGLKGFLPVILAKAIFGRFEGESVVVLSAVMAVLGHIFPVWLKLKGGKGVSTTIFVLFAVDWRLALFLCLMWGNTFLITRISALSALVAIMATTLLSLLFLSFEITAMCLFLCFIIVIRHIDNIKRILNKNELGFGKKGK
jgi:glycerol-3-phosphate acyltransferase PlsY